MGAMGAMGSSRSRPGIMGGGIGAMAGLHREFGVDQAEREFMQRRAQKKVQDQLRKKEMVKERVEKDRVALDSKLSELRARPHARLFQLDDDVAIPMARRLVQDETRTRNAEERITLAKEKKTAVLRHTKLSDWVTEDKSGGLPELEKLQKNFRTKVESKDAEPLAMALIEMGKSIAGKDKQNALLLFKAAMHHFEKNKKERPKLRQRIDEMEDALFKMKQAGIARAAPAPEEIMPALEEITDLEGGLMVDGEVYHPEDIMGVRGLEVMGTVQEGDEEEGEEEEGEEEEEEEAAQVVGADDPTAALLDENGNERTALQMAKDKWDLRPGKWKGLSPAAKKEDMDYYQQIIDANASDKKEKAGKKKGAKKRGKEERRSSKKKGKQGSSGAKMAGQIMAHQANLRSILALLKLDEPMRDQIEAEMCGDLLTCQKNLLMVEAGRVAHEAVIVSEKFKRLDKENAENEREAEKLDEKLDKQLKRVWQRFAQKNHPDKAGSEYDAEAFAKAEAAARVLRNARARLQYFVSTANENISAEAGGEEEEEVQQIMGAQPNRCSKPWMQLSAERDEVTVDWSCEGAAFSGVFQYRLETRAEGSSGEWALLYKGPRPSWSGRLGEIERDSLVRAIAINKFGPGEESTETSLAEAERREAQASAGGGGGGALQRTGSAKLSGKQLLAQRRKQDAAEQLRFCMSTMAQRSVNAADELSDAVKAFEKVKKLSTGVSQRTIADDNDLIGRAKSLISTLEKRKDLKAEISGWRHDLKWFEVDQFHNMLNAVTPEQVDPTIVNMIRQSIESRFKDKEELRDRVSILEVASRRDDIFKPKWRSAFYTEAVELRKKADSREAQQERDQAAQQKRLQAKEAAQAERRRRQEEEQAYRLQRESEEAQQQSAALSKMSKTAAKNAKRREKKKRDKAQQEATRPQSDDDVERESAEHERRLREEAEARRAQDEAERQRLAEVLAREQEQQRREPTVSEAWGTPPAEQSPADDAAAAGAEDGGWATVAASNVRAGTAGGKAGGKAVAKSTKKKSAKKKGKQKKAKAQQPSDAEDDWTCECGWLNRARNDVCGGLHLVDGRLVKTGRGCGAPRGEGKRPKGAQATPNKQPATPIRAGSKQPDADRAEPEPESEPSSAPAWAAGSGPRLQVAADGVASVVSPWGPAQPRTSEAAQQAAELEEERLRRHRDARAEQAQSLQQQSPPPQQQSPVEEMMQQAQALARQEQEADMRRRELELERREREIREQHERQQREQREQAARQAALVAPAAPAPAPLEPLVVFGRPQEPTESPVMVAEVVAESVLPPMDTAAPSIVAHNVTHNVASAPAAPAQQADFEDLISGEAMDNDEDYEVLVRFLTDQKMLKHKETLIENEVNFSSLEHFGESDYKELGIAKGPRVKMLRVLPIWKQAQLDKLEA